MAKSRLFLWAVFAFASFVFLFLASMSNAADVKLAWDANTETNLAGYKVHYGLTSQIPFEHSVDVGNVLIHTVTGLGEDVTYFFAVTAYNDKGEESAYSDILEYVVRAGRVIIRIIDRPKSVHMVFD